MRSLDRRAADARTRQAQAFCPSLAAPLAFVWLGFAIYTVLQQISGVLTFRDFTPHFVQHLIFLTVYMWLPWVLFAPIVAAGSARFPIRPDNWATALLAHSLMLVAIAFAHGIGIAIPYHYLDAPGTPMATYQPWQHAGHFLFGDDMLLFDMVVYAVFAATLNIRNFHQIVRQQELDASKLNQRLAELRLQTLRMQIDPHFLFNALNAISVLIKKGENERAEKTIGLLSGFFRHTLESSDRHWVTLEEELELVRQYIAIAQVRFGDRLAVQEHCDASVRHAGAGDAAPAARRERGHARLRRQDRPVRAQARLPGRRRPPRDRDRGRRRGRTLL